MSPPLLTTQSILLWYVYRNSAHGDNHSGVRNMHINKGTHNEYEIAQQWSQGQSNIVDLRKLVPNKHRGGRSSHRAQNKEVKLGFGSSWRHKRAKGAKGLFNTRTFCWGKTSLFLCLSGAACLVVRSKVHYNSIVSLCAGHTCPVKHMAGCSHIPKNTLTFSINRGKYFKSLYALGKHDFLIM